MSRVRIGVIGAGWWATTCHLPAFAKRNDVQLVAVCRLGAELLQGIKEKFGFAFATEDYRELLQQDLDGVVVCSPHNHHYEHARAALEKGCHVLCEKPMALQASEAWDLVALAARRNLELMIPYGWNYKPCTRAAKQFMEDGIVGDVEHVVCHMASPTKMFFSGKMIPPPGFASDVQPDPDTWCVKEHGGGYAYGQVSHSTGLLFWLTTLPRLRGDCIHVVAQFSGRHLQRRSECGLTMVRSEYFQVPRHSLATTSSRSTCEFLGARGYCCWTSNGSGWTCGATTGHIGTSRCRRARETTLAMSLRMRFIDLIQGHGRNDSPGEVGARSVEFHRCNV